MMVVGRRRADGDAEFAVRKAVHADFVEAKPKPKPNPKPRRQSLRCSMPGRQALNDGEAHGTVLPPWAS